MNDRELDEHTTYIQEYKKCPEIQVSMNVVVFKVFSKLVTSGS